MLCSKTNIISKSTSGFTMFEMLVVLSLIAIITAVSVQSFRMPSSSMKLKAAFSEIVSLVGKARQKAITLGEKQELDLVRNDININDCNGGDPKTAVFFPDGTAMSALYCAEYEEEKLRFKLDDISARLEIQ